MKKLRLIKLVLGTALLSLIGSSFQSCRITCYIPATPTGNNNVRTLSNDHNLNQDTTSQQENHTVTQDSTSAE